MLAIKDCFTKFLELLKYPCDEKDAIKYFNLTEYDLALNYFPLTYEETWSHYPKVYYQEFKYPISRIVNCENKTHVCKRDYIISKNKKPLGKVRYQYLPIDKISLDDVSDYSSICLDCIVYGMLSEYFISEGEYEIASMWSHRYKQEISHLQGCCVTCEPPQSGSNVQKPYSLYQIIEEEPIQIINHETTSIIKCAENERAFADLLNQEIKELTSSLIEKTLLPILEKELELARAERDKHINFDREAEEKKDYDKSQFHRKQSIWYDGQLVAYQNMINILKGDK